MERELPNRVGSRIQFCAYFHDVAGRAVPKFMLVLQCSIAKNWDSLFGQLDQSGWRPTRKRRHPPGIFVNDFAQREIEQRLILWKGDLRPWCSQPY